MKIKEVLLPKSPGKISLLRFILIFFSVAVMKCLNKNKQEPQPLSVSGVVLFPPKASRTFPHSTSNWDQVFTHKESKGGTLLPQTTIN